MMAMDFMSTNLVTVGPGHSIAHAAQIMLDNKVSGLPIMGDDGLLIGILTEGDLMRRTELGGWHFRDSSATASKRNEEAGDYIRSRSWRVSDVMSSDIISVPPDCPLDRIGELMDRHHCKRVPVLDDGKMLGVVSRADLLRAIVTAPLEHIILTDYALRTAIVARLVTDAGLKEFDLQAMVEDGHVTLAGIVQTINQREAARVAAESVRGCKSVTNEITLSEAEQNGG